VNDMILPKGKTVHENMNTSYTNLSELLMDLKANSFTGYLSVTFLDYEGTIFVDGGNVINAYENAEGNVGTGNTAFAGIMRKTKERDGSVSAYGLTSEMVVALAGLIKNDPVYEGLDSELTSLDKLLEKEAAAKLTGFIEVSLLGGKSTGIVLLQGGEVLEAFISDASGAAKSGAGTLSEMKELAAGGAVFNVYRADIAGAFAESTEILESFEIGDLLEVLHEIIVKVKVAADAAAGKDVFDNAFAEELVAKAADYAFLDPFAAEFEYRNGKIDYSGEASLKEFVKGVSESLVGAVDKLGEKYPQETITENVASALSSSQDIFGDQIMKYGLDTTLGRLWGK
jgi:hypothetical protein